MRASPPQARASAGLRPPPLCAVEVWLPGTVLVFEAPVAEEAAVAGLGALDLGTRLAKLRKGSAMLEAASRIGRLGPKRPLRVSDPPAQPVALKLAQGLAPARAGALSRGAWPERGLQIGRALTLCDPGAVVGPAIKLGVEGSNPGRECRRLDTPPGIVGLLTGPGLGQGLAQRRLALVKKLALAGEIGEVGTQHPPLVAAIRAEQAKRTVGL